MNRMTRKPTRAQMAAFAAAVVLPGGILIPIAMAARSYLRDRRDKK